MKRFLIGRRGQCLVGLVAGMLAVAAAGAVEPDARQILDAAGVKAGLVVHVGCGDGKLTAALRASDSYLVHGLDADTANVAKAREYIQGLGVYGKVSVDRWIGARLPYADNLVTLLVSEDLGEVPMAEVMRVLSPNGVAYIKSGRTWAKTVKPRGRIDEWGHFLHGADGNPVAADHVVGPPKHVQWMCGPRWSKHHEKFPPTIPVLVSAGGRLFYMEDETPAAMFNVQAKWYLTARNAFNGVLLWRRALPEWSPEKWHEGLGSWSRGPVDYKHRLVAAGDRVYVTLGQSTPVSALDAATGETIRTFGHGAEHTEIRHESGVVYVASGQVKGKVAVTAYDAGTGRKLWDQPGGRGIAVSGGGVFFVDGKQVGALDAATGRPLWSVSPLPPSKPAGKNAKPKRGVGNLTGPIRAGAGVVLVCPGNRGTVTAMSAKTGEVLWTRTNEGFRTWFRPVDACIIDGLVWMTVAGKPEGDVRDDYLAVGLDPMTGKVRKSVPCGQVWNSGHHQRCYPTKATERYFIYSRRGSDFLDLATGKVTLNNWTRGACTYGVLPCNGLMYSPPHACRCYSETALRGLHALAPARTGTGNPDDAPRFEKGPAYGAIGNRQSIIENPTDWPTYRHDAARSGRTASGVSTGGLKAAWRTKLGGRLSSVVVAGGTLFVAAVDAHAVHALDVRSGKPVWRFTAGGRVDSPPTIAGGCAVFGCEDGWVYCLRADDGQLVWRFRAAPEERRIGSFGQLASAWPVHGSVLVRDGVAYVAAGRNSYVDGGIYVYGLDVATGEKRYAHRLHGPFTQAGMTRENPNRGFVDLGATPDVLVADAKRIYMRHMAFDPALKTATDMNVNFWPATKLAGEEFGGDHKFWCDIMEAPRLALKSKPEWYHRSYFYQWPGRRLYSTVGLLDDSWHIRSYWSYGQVVGQQIVFDGDRAFAVKAYPNAARWASYKAGDGYVLYGGKTGAPTRAAKIFALRPQEFSWEVKVPLRPKAMVLAGETLLLAGVPDAADPAEALAALEGKKGALLWAVAAATGERQAEVRLDSPPVYDGMIVAGGRVFVATADGSVRCLAGE